MFRRDPAKFIVAAEAAMAAEDWRSAVEAWKKVVRILKAKTPANNFRKLSAAYRQLKEYDEAEALLIQALKYHDYSMPLMIELAEVLLAKGDTSGAIQTLDQITADEPLFKEKAPVKVFIRHARLLLQQGIFPGSFNAADEVLGIGLERFPDNQELQALAVLAVAARARALRERGELDEAERVVRAGLRSHRGDLVLKVEEAEILTHRQHWPKALKAWKTVVAHADIRLPAGVDATQLGRFNASIIERIINLKAYREEIKRYQTHEGPRKIAIITSVTQGYDTLKPPARLDDRFDYVAYTDANLDGMGIYDIRPLPEPQHDGPRAIRYAKTHPHVLFPDYDTVVWVDTSLMIVGDIMPMIERFMASDKPIGSNVHSARRNIYEEFQANVARNKDDYKMLKRQVDHYKAEGFKHDDLAENGLLMFNIKHPKLVPAMEEWWQQILRFSRRDQLSFNYSLAKHGAEWYPLTKPPQGVRNHPDFVILPHHTDQFALNVLREAL